MPLGLFGGGTGSNPANNVYLGDPTLQKIDQQDYADNALKTNAFTGQKNSQDQLQQGKDTFGAGQEKTNQAGGYFSSLLGGREEANAAVSPEVSTVLEQFDQAHKAASEFAPRGGGRATTNNSKPFALAGIIGKLLQSARGGAATSLASIGASQTSAGLESTGQGNQALQGSSGAAGALEQSDVARDNATKQLVASITASIMGQAGK